MREIKWASTIQRDLMLLNFNFRSEYIRKVDTSDDNDEDTVEFTLKKSFEFRPELSEGLTGDEIVTTLHPGEIDF